MHLLLPPSEGKHPGGRGRPLKRHNENGPLGPARSRVLDAVAQLVAGDPHTAATALLLPAGVAATALATNSAVRSSPTVPALRRYAGVVYDGLQFAALEPAEQRLALRSVRIFSGLFGVLRGDEPVPDYRVPAKAVLPGLGVAATYWRPILDDALDLLLCRGLIVDLRSGDYRAMWRPGPAAVPRTVTVRILSPAPRGGHAVISFTSKLAKGHLAAALIRRAVAGLPVDGAADVLAAWRGCAAADVPSTDAAADAAAAAAAAEAVDRSSGRAVDPTDLVLYTR